VLLRGVPGHVIECGCWRGGTALLAAAAFEAYDVEADGRSNGARWWKRDRNDSLPHSRLLLGWQSG